MEEEERKLQKETFGISAETRRLKVEKMMKNNNKIEWADTSESGFKELQRKLKKFTGK